MKLVTIFLFLPIFGISEFPEDLKKLTEHFECDPLCTFNHSEITSNTIEFFPRCAEVCGILKMNENLDLDESQLKEVFGSMRVLFGGIAIENTKLKNLNFFNVNNQFKEFNMFCELFGFHIKNNGMLRNVDIIQRFYLYGDDDGNECDFRIEYNEQLNTEKLVDRWNMKGHYDVRTNWNKEDWVCRQDELLTIASLEYKTCNYMFGGLRLNGVKDVNELYHIQGLEYLFGPLIVENTELENLTVLSTLEWIRADVLRKDEPAFINLKNNPRMKALGTTDLFTLQGNHIVNLENLHPDFCLTYEDMRRFLKFRTLFIHLDVADYCAGSPWFLSDDELYFLKDLKDLPSDYRYISGDLVIGPGDENYVNKLEQIAYLLGKLIVNGTELEDLNFLSNLKGIASLDDSQPIQIINNQKLRNAKLLKLESIITKGPQYVLLENNHPDVSENFMDLFSRDFQKWINYTNEYIVPLRVVSSGDGKMGFWILILSFSLGVFL